MIEKGCGAKVAARESKHIQLLNSIMALEKTCERSEAFYSELLGAPDENKTQPECGKTPGEPSFDAVFTQAPARIGEVNARLNDLLGRMRDVLY